MRNWSWNTKNLRIVLPGTFSGKRAGVLSLLLLFIQPTPITGQPRFEAATVKPDSPAVTATFTRAIGGPGTSDPGRVHYDHRTLRMLLMTAFDRFEYQIKGPAWLDSERYSVEGLVPPAASRQDLKTMLENLIVDRFAITYTIEKLPLNGFLLSLDHGSRKLTPASPAAPSASPLRLVPKRFEFFAAPVTEGVLQTGSVHGNIRLAGFSVALETLSHKLAELLQCPVENGTGLAGFYDMDLVYSREQAISRPDDISANLPADRAGLLTEIREQLGLKLVRKKIETPIMIIQSAQKTPRND